MFTNTKIECIGYAFEQNYTNGIAISRDTDRIGREADEDAALLQELKEIVSCFESELPYITNRDELRWDISDEMIEKVMQATSIYDV